MHRNRKQSLSDIYKWNTNYKHRVYMASNTYIGTREKRYAIIDVVFQGDVLGTQLVSAVEGHRQECHLNKFVVSRSYPFIPGRL